MLVYNAFVSAVFLLELLGKDPRFRVLTLISFGLMTVFIGLREEIGADWFGYLEIFERASHVGFYEYVGGTDILFGFVAFAVNAAGGNVYVLNVISFVVFLVGIYELASNRLVSREWFILALLPYFIVVVAPNYLRQAMALGLFCWSISKLIEHKVVSSIMLSILGGFFHSSAVFGLLLILSCVLWGGARLNRKYLLMLVPIIVGLLVLFVGDRIVSKYIFYTEVVTRESSGAFLRLALYAFPFCVYLMFLRGRLSAAFVESFIKASLLLFLFCIPLSLIDSIIGDRVAIYTIPAQAMILSLLVKSSKAGFSRTMSSFIVIGYSLFQLNVWLMFSVWAKKAWLPYNNVLYGVF